MRIVVYKGFEKDFYQSLDIPPLVEGGLDEKFDLTKLAGNYDKCVVAATFTTHAEAAYLTYEEYVAAYGTLVSPLFAEHTIEVVRNNIYPEIYPMQSSITGELFDKYQLVKNSERDVLGENQEVNLLLKFFSEIYYINGKYYVSYHNTEIKNSHVECVDYYHENVNIQETHDDTGYDYFFDICDNVEQYVESLNELAAGNYKVVAFRDVEKTEITKLSIASLKAFCGNRGLELKKLIDEEHSHIVVRQELKDTTKTMIEAGNHEFTGFKNFKIYTKPRMSNETELVSQGDIMEHIAREAENAAEGRAYRDIFFTAPTGAGKSITFQVPARYIADKYGKLVIVIEPLKGLMKDQVDNLRRTYGSKVDFINSDVAIPAERDRIIEGIKNGKINILYVSPETLISRTIESLVGEREIGLLIIDEAHIVTAWGMGFRPDYWYLGAYINRLRSERNGRGMYKKDRKVDRFPIFACTATAVNGGLDDTVSETFTSLTMNDPIVILGYSRRDQDIKFNIRTHLTEKYTKNEYKVDKADKLADSLRVWQGSNEKTIVYTPYRSIAEKMKNASDEFQNFGKINNATGIYTGGGTDPNQKNEDMDKFKSGEIQTMYATKAFGMGVDVKDVNNVYHYAPTGSLADYVQEIGRVARKEGMVGLATTDYYKQDLQYIDALYGMSQITKTHIMRCLRIIYDAYKQNGYRQRFMVAPSMFSSVFVPTSRQDDDRSVEVKLKIALLMIEKDLRNTYRVPVFVSRPGTVFTNSYVRVHTARVNDVRNSKYGQYFIEKDRVSDGQNSYVIYEVQLSKIWEDKAFGYDKMSFPEFKFHYYNYKNETDPDKKVMREISNYYAQQAFLSLEAQGDSVGDLYDLAKRHINFIMECLTSFGGRFFTIEDFSKKLAKGTRDIKYSKLQADSIANAFFSLVDPYEKSVHSRMNKKNFMTEYNIVDGNVRNLTEAILEKSPLVRELMKHYGKKYECYMSLDAREDSDALKLISLFDIASYTVEGGNEPQISIWLNSPDKIRQIVTGRIQYNNKYVERAHKKHKRSVKILRHFFENLRTDDERWGFIERYFLGEDVLKEIQGVSTDTEQIKVQPIAELIKSGTGLDLKAMYKDWQEFAKTEEMNNAANSEKYLYAYKQLAKAGVRLADKAAVEIETRAGQLSPLFVFEKENVVVLSEFAKKSDWDFCRQMGWTAVGIDKLEDEVSELIEALNG